MNWIALAVSGHLLNAISFVVDKALLRSAFKRSASYAAMVGSLSLVVLAAAPWVREWPGLDILLPTAAFGALFVLGLWAFFEALARAEASRVVPVVGSLIPLITLLELAIFFHEQLTLRQGTGFALLLVAMAMVTSGRTRIRFDRKTLALAVGSAVLFATASVFGKDAFLHGDFLGVFVASRVAAGLTGVLIGLFAPGAWAEWRRAWRPKQAGRPRGSLAWTATGQVAGALGFTLVQLAINGGDPAIVNALQAVQYAAIVLVAWLGGRRLRTLLQEERTVPIVIRKSLAIVLVAIGLALIA